MSRDPAYLLDMLISARDARRFIDDLSIQRFQESDLHQHAVAKAVELVGEAAARVSAETRAQHPEIPWHQIVGMRNRLVHDYVSLDLTVLWDVVHDHLPPLIAYLESVVPSDDSSPG